MTISGTTSRQWTQAQRRAIDHDGGDLLVSAGAGSGKTAVLAQRCARLVCAGAADGSRCGVENLLVLTFTEAAANEMRARIAAAIMEQARAARKTGGGGGGGAEKLGWLRRQAAMVDRASISTLHAFCARVLRQHFHEAVLDPNFEVMDPEDAALLRDEVLEDLLARKHRLPDGPEARAFTELFEGHASGRDGNCRDLIKRLHDFLATSDEPEAFLDKAQNAYSPEGCAATFEAYVRDCVCEELRLLHLAALRACEEVKRIVGPGPMLSELEKKTTVIDSARDVLCKKGVGGWDTARENLGAKWATCKTPAGVIDFEPLKDRTWKKVKERMEKLAEETLGADPAVMRAELGALAGPLAALIDLTQEFGRDFAAAKRAQNRLDFADLERLTLDLLNKDGATCVQELRARYHHLLIDEFQDINPLQAALLVAVSSPARFDNKGNRFLVGDVKQSIYGFRLAEPKLFLALERAWSAGTGEKLVALQHNFRSQAGLLAVMNGLFGKLLTPEVAGVDYAHGHELLAGKAGMTGTADVEGPAVELHLIAKDRGAGDDEDGESTENGAEKIAAENLSAVELEARMVADLIARLLEEGRMIADGTSGSGAVRPVKPRDIAILLRSVKSKALIFSRALDRRGIRSHADLSTGFFDAPEIRDTLALLQVLDNPRQDIALATVMLGPFGRFSHDDLAQIRLTYALKEVPFAEAAARYAADAADAGQGMAMQDKPPDPPAFDAGLAQRLGDFFAQVAAWRQRLLVRPLHEGLAEIFAESKILVYASGLEDGQQRVANLQMLHQHALRFAGFRRQGLHRFLRFLERLRGQEENGWGGGGGDMGEAPMLSEASDVVRIMSVHKAKGLEFPVVFVSGLGGRFHRGEPGSMSIHREAGIGLEVVNIEKNAAYHSAASHLVRKRLARDKMAEELRLLYVALTRARDRLILTGTINKDAALARIRRQWRGCRGALPEDVLLKANTALDWLLPALAGEGLRVSWDGVGPADAQVHIWLHGGAAEAAAAAGQDSALVQTLRAGKPLAPAAADESLRRVIDRVEGAYAFEEAARQPAVRTVTFLKEELEMKEEWVEAIPGELMEVAADVDELEGSNPPIPSARANPRGPEKLAGDPAAAERARLRGTATHRVLEMLDLTQCGSVAEIQRQIAALRERKALSTVEAELVRADDLAWALGESAAGKFLAAAAKGGRLILRREIPFVYVDRPANAGPAEPSADWPTIRGVIDALLADPEALEAQIVDYKTDAAFLYESRLEGYRLQMSYYLRAASDILGFPVKRATLLFLRARKEVVVNLHD